MKPKLFENCCRLCLDETKEQLEISEVEQLAESLLQLYALKIPSEDRCSKKICVDCYNEVNECQKWLKFHDKQKQLIRANQQRFEEELLEQLGPEPVAPAESRAARLTRRSALARAAVEEEEEIPKKLSPVKQEPVLTRSKRKIEWEPPSEAEQGSESASASASATDAATDDEEEEEEEEEDETSETGTTTTDPELKCPKCDAVFDGLQGLQSHTCSFACPICSVTVKYKHSVKRHLIQVHKIETSQLQNYLNQESNQGAPEQLLVETPKPRKRYRYESDSPTDLEEDSNAEEAPGKKELSCNYCADKFETTEQMNAHDCDYGCNICGFKFAHRGCVKRHKIRVHKIDPSDPSVQPKPRSRTPSRPSVSRPPSRPPSRAASENPSDDEPLAVLATSKSGEDVDTGLAPLSKSSEKYKYTYLCTDCEYSHRKRYRVTCHMISVHGIPKEQIDLDAIPREYIGSSPKTPDRPKTPTEKRHRSIPHRPVTPQPLPHTTPERTQTPDLIKAMATQFQHRSRSRSTYLDDLGIGQKRKRSLSACSSKSARPARSRSIPPADRQILVARRTTSSVLEKVSSKLRPTLIGIEAGRLHVEIRRGCEALPQGQLFRIRASKYNPLDPCTTKRLFKLRNPVGNERLQVNRLRDTFRNLSHRVGLHSKVNKIDVESLVLDPVPRNQNSPTELLALLEQDPFSRDFAGFAEDEFNPVAEEVEVDTKVNVVPVLNSEVVHLIEEDDNSTDVVQIVPAEDIQVIDDDDSSTEQPQESTEERGEAVVHREEGTKNAPEEQDNEEPENHRLENEENEDNSKNTKQAAPTEEPEHEEETEQTQGPAKKPKLDEAPQTTEEVEPAEPTKETEPIEETQPSKETEVVDEPEPTKEMDEADLKLPEETGLIKDKEPAESVKAVEPMDKAMLAVEPEPKDDTETSEETDPMKDTGPTEPMDAVELTEEAQPEGEPETSDDDESSSETDPMKDTEPTNAVERTDEDEPEPTDNVESSDEAEPMDDTDETSETAQTKDTDASEEAVLLEETVETKNTEGTEHLTEVALLDEDSDSSSECEGEGQDEDLLITPD